jgi:regulator of protease activity HflC (stomatin/prohibitin superfamily)
MGNIFSIAGGIVILVLVTIGYILRKSLLNIVIVEEGEWILIQRFGQFVGIGEAGIHWLPKPFYSAKEVCWSTLQEGPNGGKVDFGYKGIRISKKVQIFDPSETTVKTSDNLSLVVNPVMQFRITDPYKAAYSIENLYAIMSELIQTTILEWSSGKTAEEIRRGAKDLKVNIESELKANTERLGFNIERIDLQEVSYPKELVESTCKTEIVKRQNIEAINLAESQTAKELHRINKASEVEMHDMNTKCRNEETKAKREQESKAIRLKLDVTNAVEQQNSSILKFNAERSTEEAKAKKLAEHEITMINFQREQNLLQKEAVFAIEKQALEASIARMAEEAKLKEATMNVARIETVGRTERELAVKQLIAEARIKEVESEIKTQERLFLEEQERARRKQALEIELLKEQHAINMKIKEDELLMEERKLGIKYKAEVERARELIEAGVSKEMFIVEQMKDSMTALATSGNVVMVPTGTTAMDVVGANILQQFTKCVRQ